MDVYTQRFKAIGRTLDLVLAGFVPDWVNAQCPNQFKDEFKRIQQIAEKNAYRIADGSLVGYSKKPLKILIADPVEDYDEHIAGFIRDAGDAGLLKDGVVLADGYSGKVILAESSANKTIAPLTVFSNNEKKRIVAKDFTRYALKYLQEKKIPLEYDDSIPLLKELRDNSAKSYWRMMRAIEQRNYHAIAPALARHADKIAIQKLGLAETLEGSTQQNLLMEEIPYIVLVPTQLKVKKEQTGIEFDAIATYIEKNVAKTIERIKEL